MQSLSANINNQIMLAFNLLLTMLIKFESYDEILLFPTIMIYCLYLLTLLLNSGVNARYNSDPTFAIVGSDKTAGTQIAISPEEDVIAVGFADGTFKILAIQLDQLCSTNSNNGSIIDLIWLPSFGPVTLDSTNTITLWDTDCNITNSISFNESITDITGHEIQKGDQNQTIIAMVAANFQARIEAYDIETADQLMVFSIPEQEKSLEIIFNPDGKSNVLLVSTNASLIRKFEIENGTQVQEFEVESPILQMAKISVYTGDVVIGIAQNNHIIRFDSTGEVLDRGEFPRSVSLTICPRTKQFALASAQLPSVSIHIYSGQIQQTISALQTPPQSIDCSLQYLVTLDQKGGVQVYTQEEFKSEIIVIIGGVLGGLVFLIVVVILIMKYRSKMIRDKNEEQYRSRVKNKYPREMAKMPNKQQSVQLLKMSTLETTMQE